MTAQTNLHVQLFGELSLRHGERTLTLPPSKKTRALLAYLVLTERPHRREQLCRLFWDVTDDVRGALRWSLSKLRPLLDVGGVTRLVADREHVRFERRACWVDAHALRDALRGRSLEHIALEQLEELAERHSGELLEGLELPDFDDYQAFCLAEREEARALRVQLSAELVARRQAEPARALAHARRWLAHDPWSEPARSTLIGLLARLGRMDEARQYYESGVRLDAELGRRARVEPRESFEALVSRHAPMRVEVAAPAHVAPPQAPVGDAPAPFVGRAGEQSFLDAALARVSARESLELIVFSGEPGIGKTRLLERWTHTLAAQQVRVVSTTSYEAESGRPYAAWREALPLELSAPPDSGGRERLFDSASEAIEHQRAGVRALVLVFDDVQWLDEGSAELLHHVVRTHREQPLLFVLLAREGELRDNAALARVLRGFRRDGRLTERTLGPLLPDETEHLVRALAGRRDVQRIAAESNGNPLFALELARAGLEREDSVPATLSSLIRDRLSQLPPESADVLRWAAVLGCGFGVDRIAQLTSLGTEALLDALDQLERRGVLRFAAGDHNQYEWSHELVRRVTYTDLSEPRRRLMHRRVAELLRGLPEYAEQVADVARHAALAQDARLAAEACLSAARHSLRLFANADAHALARRGMRHAEQLDEPEQSRLLLELLEVSLAARRPEHVGEVMAQLELLAERTLDLGSLEHARLGFHLLSHLSFEHGAWADAQKQTLQAELVSRSGNERERVAGLAEAARCLVLLERDLPHAQALALEARARARHGELESAAISDGFGLLRQHQGRGDEAQREFERARALAHAARDRHDEFQALEHLVLLELERARYQDALRRAEELRVLGDKMREGSEAAFARSLVSLCQLALGDAAADAALETELHALVQADAKHRLLHVLARAAWLQVEQGEYARAELRAARALEIAERLARPSERVISRAVLLRCARARGDAGAVQAQCAALAQLPLDWVSTFARKLAEQSLEVSRGDDHRRA